ncbi:unnamed protein product [Symbiodinium natans]|uniref:Gamma-interferon-inducible lysosomal thiol reductase n=1 Tax=Symbiodinium natans TaxID=878477 RepID=A0A812MSF7_9DINO|nr:unnamed protein product [Symbiodinium natans]
MKVWLSFLLAAVCGGTRYVRHSVHQKGFRTLQQEKSNLRWPSSSAIAVEFFVMSKCPDAKLCEETFLPVLQDLTELVTVNFTYIADVTREEPASVRCMHGPEECMGNSQRLCVQRAGNATDLRFAKCQDSGTIPGNGKACAVAAGFTAAELEDLEACWSGALGQALLRESAKRASALSVTTSCTLQVGNKDFCIHDGGWRNCGSCGSDKAACLKAKVCELSGHARKSELCA